MSSALVSIIIVPGIVALFLCVLFGYLYSQSRERYFRAWQVGWILYLLHYIAIGIYYGKFDAVWQLNWLAQLFTVGTVLCILASTDMVERHFTMGPSYVALVVVGAGWSLLDAWTARDPNADPAALHLGPVTIPHLSSALFAALVLFWCAYRFWR